MLKLILFLFGIALLSGCGVNQVKTYPTNVSSTDSYNYENCKKVVENARAEVRKDVNAFAYDTNPSSTWREKRMDIEISENRLRNMQSQCQSKQPKKIMVEIKENTYSIPNHTKVKLSSASASNVGRIKYNQESVFTYNKDKANVNVAFNVSYDKHKRLKSKLKKIYRSDNYSHQNITFQPGDEVTFIEWTYKYLGENNWQITHCPISRGYVFGNPFSDRIKLCSKAYGQTSLDRLQSTK